MIRIGRRNLRKALAGAVPVMVFALAGPAAAATCFKVYDDRGQLTYEGQQSPVDLRDAGSESWTKLRGRGEHLVWHPSPRCQRDEQPATRTTAAGNKGGQSNAELLLSRIPAFAGGR